MSTLSVTSPDLPFNTSGGNFQGPEITIDNGALASCRITGMRVFVAATASNLASLGTDWVMRIDRTGGPIGFDLFVVGSTALTGSQMGSGCSTLRFEDGAPAFSTAVPPYNGTFRPRGDNTSPDSFADYLNTNPNGNYGLYPAFIDAPMTITCFRLDFDLATAPPTLRDRAQD